MLKKWEDLFQAEEEELYFWENDCENPSLEEVGQAIRGLANGKMAGEDNLPNEFYKYGGKPLIKIAYHFITKC